MLPGLPRLGANSGIPQTRLPVHPRHLDITVEVLPERPTLRIEALLTFAVGADLEEVALRLRPDLELDFVENEDALRLAYRRADERVVVATPPLASGTMATWRFGYRLRLPEVLEQTGQVISVAPWYPYAHYPEVAGEFPRNVPVSSTVSARLPAPWTIVAPGNLVRRGEGDERTLTWREEIPTSLIPLLIARLEEHDARRGGDRLQRAFHPVGGGDAGKDYFDYMVAALGYYEDLLGPLPRRRMNLLGVDLPARLGGFSAPGIVVMPAGATRRSPLFPYRIFAHEVAHSWWNDSVYVPRRADFWLREGLPTYNALMFLEHTYGAPRFRRELARSREVALSVKDPVPLDGGAASAGPAAAYALNYHKAAFVLHMLRTVMGSRNFRYLLQEFHAAGGGVTAPRLRTLAEQIYADDLSWFFAAWVEGTEVPSFVVRYQQHATASDATPFELRATIAQLDADIRHPVMVRIALEGAPPVEKTVWIGPGTTEFSLAVPSPVRDFHFDPLGDMLHRGVSIARLDSR